MKTLVNKKTIRQKIRKVDETHKILREVVVTEAATEFSRQDDKWGIQGNTPDRWMLILGEEFGEAAKAILENKLHKGKGNLEQELTHVASVAIQAITDLRRQRL